MPYPIWHHSCLCPNPTTTHRPVCPTCGETGVARWGLHLIEAMGRYQYTYGLLPIGPHRPLADALFAGARQTCPGCGGPGILDPDGQGWGRCAYCEGTGGFWTIEPEAVEALRRQVLEAFPEAEASGDIRFLTDVLALNLATGEVVALAQAVAQGEVWDELG